MTRQEEDPPRIERLRRQAVARYPGLWNRVTDEWRADSADDRAWLVYSANYVLRTQNVRWAIDPLTLRWRVPEAEPVPIQRSLAHLSFVVLTHRHADHLDLDLVRRLNRLPILWIVPESLRPRLLAEAGLRRPLVEVARHEKALDIGPIRITPFEGLHDEYLDGTGEGGTLARRRRIPSLGLLAEFGLKRWLFPGDTRTYALHRLPRLGVVDGLFAHVWLGRGSAQDGDPPLKRAFCRFCLDLQPQRIVLTHLEEFGRRAADFWEVDKADGVHQCLRELDHRVVVERAMMGDSVLL